MAKQRKKRNKREKEYPKLSKTDKCIYDSLFLIMILLFCGFIYYRLYWRENYFLKSDSTLACSLSASSIVALLPLCITAFVVFGIIANKFTGKYPIFGNKRVNYHDTSKYLPTLPLFDKRYSFSEYKQMYLSKKSKRNTIILFAAILITYSISLFGIFGRNELKTNSIEKYNCLNNLKEQYSYSEVVSYSVESKPSTHGKYSHSPSSILINLTLRNGKTMFFDYSDFNCNAYSMQKVTERLNNAEKHTDDTFIDEFFDDYDLTDDEKQIVLQLFN